MPAWSISALCRSSTNTTPTKSSPTTGSLIATDLEILQTEGFDASRVVDPHMVTKKKDGKDVEVQEGWRGRILPFELVQLAHHKPELDALRAKETRLSEEEKANDTVNDAGDKFVSAAVRRLPQTTVLLANCVAAGDTIQRNGLTWTLSYHWRDN